MFWQLKEMFWQLNGCSMSIFWWESCKKPETSIDTNTLKKDSLAPNSASDKKQNFKNTNNYKQYNNIINFKNKINSSLYLFWTI